MGGHALSEGLTERKSLADYSRIKQVVLEKLQSDAHGVLRVSSITEMPGKQEFGDLDLLYIREFGVDKQDVKCLLQTLFSPTEMVACAQVTSFDFERFQIDMIECEEYNFEMSNFCLSFGDRGMILGQIARWQGFTLGSQGLAISPPDIETVAGIRGVTEKLTLTVNPAEVRAYMGVPLEDESLETPQDVANFCRQCEWFRPEQFTRKFNSENRKRWASRPFYKSFVEGVIADFGYGEAEGVQAVKGDATEFVRPVNTSRTCLHISAEEQQALRLANIKDALTRFNKWGEIEDLRRKHFARVELREKLNYRQFLDLGLATCHLNEAKNSFAQWLGHQLDRDQQESVCHESAATNMVDPDGASSDNHDAQRASVASVDTTSMSTEALLAYLVKDMNSDDVCGKLQVWFAEVWQARTNRSAANVTMK